MADQSDIERRLRQARDHARSREREAEIRAVSPDDQVRMAGLIELSIFESIAEVLDVAVGDEPSD